ncbi:MAG: DUF927 domain-containing protein [Chloroflexota bacterium]|nr:DUF927 domain-containing protein [Chloroflexota bacterium]
MTSIDASNALATPGPTQLTPPTTSPTDWSQLGNFTARIMEDRQHVGAEDRGGAVFLIEVVIDGQTPVRGEITAAEFENNQTLRIWLRKIGRSKLRFKPKLIDDIRNAILAAHHAECTTTYDITGWADIDGAEHFLMPGYTVGLSQPRVRLPAQGRLDGYSFVALDEEETRAALRVLVEVLLEVMPPRIAYPVLAHVFLPPIHRWLGTTDRYLLHLLGATGTLKTTYATLAMALWGEVFAAAPPTATWGSTVNALEAMASYAKDVPFLIDDYKPGMVTSNDIVRFLQNYADGTGRDRLTRESDLKQSKIVQAHLLSTGEDAPTGEASVMARSLILRLERGDARLDHLREAQTHARLLAGLMPRFIAWLFADKTREAGVRQRFQNLQEELRFKRALSRVPNANRIATNLVMNSVSFEMMAEWLEAEGALSVGTRTRLVAAYAEVVDDLLTDTAQSVQAERSSHIFVETVASLLAAGRHAIAEDSRSSLRPGVVELGWRGSNAVFLNGSAVPEVNKVRPLNVSEHNLYSQLKEDGMLALTDKRQTTVLRTRLGQQMRVLAVRPELLGLSEAPVEIGGATARERPIPTERISDRQESA